MVADAVAAHLLAAAFTQVDRIACHLSMGTEPGTGPLITGLLKRGVDVIVPVTRAGTTRSSGWSSTPLRPSGSRPSASPSRTVRASARRRWRTPVWSSCRRWPSTMPATGSDAAPATTTARWPR